MNIKISPSILGGTFSNIEEIVLNLDKSKAEYIHFDVMDGDFVPNLTFGPKFISDVRKYSNKTFDVHLMINRVEKFLDEYIEAGSDIISFHLEIDEDIEKIITRIKKKGLKCGLAIKPNTSWIEIQPYLNHIDQAKEQLLRKPMNLPKLNIINAPESIFDFKYENFKLINYNSAPNIKAPIAI